MYFIVAMEQLPSDNYNHSYDMRTFGYYEKIEDAQEALKTNRLGIFEYMYTYALIEKIGQGIHANSTNCGWFKYNTEKKGYEELVLEEEHLANRYTNYALG